MDRSCETAALLSVGKKLTGSDWCLGRDASRTVDATETSSWSYPIAGCFGGWWICERSCEIAAHLSIVEELADLAWR